MVSFILLLFFFHDTATTEIYTLSLHDALPISLTRNIFVVAPFLAGQALEQFVLDGFAVQDKLDRKSTRLNSSHVEISYAVFCLKKKKNDLNMELTLECLSRMYNDDLDPYPLHT